MTYRRILILALAAATVLARPKPSFAQGITTAEPELIVGMAANTDTDGARPSFAAVATSDVHESAIHTHRVRLPQGVSVADAVASLRSAPGVLFVEANSIYHAQGAQAPTTYSSTPNDPYYSYQWAPEKIQANLAWTIWQARRQVIVAIVDTGVDGSHPDLVNKMLRNGGAIVGYDAVNQVAGDGRDVSGHGTLCAGIVAAAVNNGIGIAGIAGLANDDVLIMPVRALDANATGTAADIANGIIWAANNGANVINLSLGGPDSSQTVSNAIAYAWSKGCVVVAAAGNNGTAAPFYPADSPSVVSVAATDTNDTLASFTTYGAWVTVAAPGVNIASTLPTYSTGNGWPEDYGITSGTSMAAPHVAAEAALIQAQNPNLTNAEVVSIIRASADPYLAFDGHTISSSGGRINVYRALQSTGASAPPPTPPSGIAATPGDSAVTVTWHAASNAVGYTVMRATGVTGAYKSIATLTGPLQFVDKTTANGTTYVYVISARNSAGATANSAPAAATPQAPPPAPPIDLMAFPARGSITLSWFFSPQSGRSSVHIYRSTTRGGKLTLFRTISATTLWTDTSVPRSATYYYAVSDTGSNGKESALTNTVSATAK